MFKLIMTLIVCCSVLSCTSLKIDSEYSIHAVSENEGKVYLLYGIEGNTYKILEEDKTEVESFQIPELSAIDISGFEFKGKGDTSVLYWSRESRRYCLFNSSTGQTEPLGLPSEITYISLRKGSIFLIEKYTNIFSYNIAEKSCVERKNDGFGVPIYCDSEIIGYWSENAIVFTKDRKIYKRISNPEWKDYRMLSISVADGCVAIIQQIPLYWSKLYYSSSLNDDVKMIGDFGRIISPLLVGKKIYYLSVSDMYKSFGTILLGTFLLE